MYTDIDEDIQSLVEAMKDTLNDAKQCRNPWATDRSERCLFDVIRLITEGAALIDEWNHTHVLGRFLLRHTDVPTSRYWHSSEAPKGI